MGFGSFNVKAYSTYASSVTTDAQGRDKSIREVFKPSMVDSLNPYFIQLRESRDSEDSPEATPVIIGLDVTGSMGYIAHKMVKESLGILMSGILENKPITDPHLMFMAIGDAAYDSAPLQVSQFEADIRIAQQLTDIYVEGGGGGNCTESYDLPWYFAATKIQTDSFTKRGKKGYLFTIGDELPPTTLLQANMQRIFSLSYMEGDHYQSQEWLKKAQEQWEVFHIIVEEGSYASSNLDRVCREWRSLLGRRAIRLLRHQDLPHVILAVMQVNEGLNPEVVIAESQAPETLRHALFE